MRLPGAYLEAVQDRDADARGLHVEVLQDVVHQGWGWQDKVRQSTLWWGVLDYDSTHAVLPAGGPKTQRRVCTEDPSL